MKIKFTSALLSLLLFSFFASATIAPATYHPQTILPKPSENRPGFFKRISDKKNILVQKLAFRIIQKKLDKQADRGFASEKQRRQAKWSMALGIFSLISLFTPLILLSFFAAVAGLILGIKSVKGNSNAKGIVGIVTSSVTLLIFLLAIIFILAIFLSFNF